MLDIAGSAHALKEVQEPGDVAVDVRLRVLEGIAHSGLRGEVDYATRFM